MPCTATVFAFAGTFVLMFVFHIGNFDAAIGNAPAGYAILIEVLFNSALVY